MFQHINKLAKNNLFINGNLIMLSRGIGSVTGYIFWVLAARFIVPADVGLASSIISASLFISGLAQLGYGYGLVRFLPLSKEPNALINLAFETTSVLSTGFTLFFLLYLHILSPDLLIIRSNVFSLISFFILVVATGINQILGWVFFARKKFTYTILVISVQSIASIILLAAFASADRGPSSILSAYTLSSVIGLLLSYWLFQTRTDPGFRLRFTLPRPGNSAYKNYLISSFLTDQLLKSANTLLPLLVISVLGAEANAYFYVSWAIVSGTYTLIGGIAASFFTEGAHQPEKAKHLMVTSSIIGVIYSFTALIGIGLFSKIILGMFGADYAANANALFLVLLVSVVPGIAIHNFFTYFRLQTNPWYLLLYAILVFMLGIGATYAGMKLFGLIGIGYGWLAGRITIALIGFLFWKYFNKENLQPTQHTQNSLNPE